MVYMLDKAAVTKKSRKLYVWWYFKQNCFCELVPVNGVMNSDQYIDILFTEFVPFMEIQYPNEDEIYPEKSSTLSHIKKNKEHHTVG